MHGFPFFLKIKTMDLLCLNVSLPRNCFRLKVYRNVQTVQRYIYMRVCCLFPFFVWIIVPHIFCLRVHLPDYVKRTTSDLPLIVCCWDIHVPIYTWNVINYRKLKTCQAVDKNYDTRVRHTTHAISYWYPWPTAYLILPHIYFT